MMFRGFLFISALLFYSVGAKAQVTLRGVALDARSHEAVPYAHVFVKGSENGVVTDRNGRFTIGVDKLPVVLVVSEIAHQTRLVRVVDTALVTVRLEPFGVELEEVEITDKRQDYFKMANHVRDFEFYDDLILLLGNSGKEVRLLSHRGSVVERTLAPAKFTEVFKDCLGNLHVVNDDVAYQVFYDYERIRFLHPFPRSVFDTYLRSCECRFGPGLIYSMGNKRGLVNTFLYAEGGETSSFYKVGDTAAINYLEREYDLDYFVRQRNKGNPAYQTSVGAMEENLEEMQNRLPVDWLDSRILEPTAYYVFPEGEKLRVFSLGIMMEFVFSDLKSEPERQMCQIREDDLDYLIKDDVTGNIYAVYRSSGRVWLNHVDRVDKEIALNRHAFPSEVKVHNDYVYFINDPAIDGSNFLFRKNRKFGAEEEAAY